jgi:flagellar hook-associated protein 2
MTEKEIEKWEEKAKYGILRNNSVVAELCYPILNKPFLPKPAERSQRGFNRHINRHYYTSDKGLLVVDSDSLKAALEKDPEKVLSIFTGGSSRSDSSSRALCIRLLTPFPHLKS